MWISRCAPFALALCVSLPQLAAAGPWIRDLGAGYVEVGYSHFAAAHGFVFGQQTPFAYRSDAVDTYAEIGLPFGLQLVFGIPYVRASHPGLALDTDIVIEISGEEVEAEADLNMLRAVLLNLLRNAGEAMAGGVRRIEIELMTREGFAAITVHDSGPGIPEEVRPRIFEPFFTTRADGTGLGLPIARRLMRVLGGELSADCPPAGGTRMTIHLPRNPQPGTSVGTHRE